MQESIRNCAVQREMESRAFPVSVYSHFEGPVWTTPPNVVAGQASLLELQLVSKRNQVG
jgi:hypothetical protein